MNWQGGEGDAETFVPSTLRERTAHSLGRKLASGTGINSLSDCDHELRQGQVDKPLDERGWAYEIR
jgi:hypothetical protein